MTMLTSGAALMMSAYQACLSLMVGRDLSSSYAELVGSGFENVFDTLTEDFGNV